MMGDFLEDDEQRTVPSGAQHTRISAHSHDAPQPTLPNRKVQPPPQTTLSPRMPMPAASPRPQQPTRSLPQTPSAAPRALPPRFDKKGQSAWLPYALLGFGALALSGIMAALFFLFIGISALRSDEILPGMSVAGVRVGGLSVEEAAAKLGQRWPVMLLEDAATDREWQISPAQLGYHLDAQASAMRAYGYGRDNGNFFGGLLGMEIAPVLSFDVTTAREGLFEMAFSIEMPAVNAGIALENGHVRATPPRDGRTIDLDGTVALLAGDPIGWLMHGAIPMKMVSLSPSITDASPMVAAAEQLLAHPLVVDVFDPVSGGITQWSVEPTSWAGWLIAAPDTASPNGLRLSLDDTAVRGFIAQGQAQLAASQYIDADILAADLQNAVATMTPQVTARVWHHDRQRVVQAGETIISIAYQEGVPYPWIQQANGGIQNVNVGQTITIPSADNFFKFEPVKHKRIVVSISEQRVIAYENGAVKWDWAASTGINSSPTWPGVYQIISHYQNAYAGNWNLWMPKFMGVYQPIPGADFTNGFHGFPTRGGGQILWENSIGTRVTYGCILLNNTNASLLYDWAEEGVIVEIRA